MILMKNMQYCKNKPASWNMKRKIQQKCVLQVMMPGWTYKWLTQTNLKLKRTGIKRIFFNLRMTGLIWQLEIKLIRHLVLTRSINKLIWLIIINLMTELADLSMSPERQTNFFYLFQTHLLRNYKMITLHLHKVLRGLIDQ